MTKPLDIVVAGPDGSGTSTQLNWFIDELSNKYGLRIKDLRGTEVDALWHAHDNPAREEAIQTQNLGEFLDKVRNAGIVKSVTESTHIDLRQIRKELVHLEYLENQETKFLRWSARKIRETPYSQPSLASMKQVAHGTLIDVDDADVWILEEPPHRLTGLHNRFFEQYRSSFDVDTNQFAAAMAHALYRETEYLRFRKEILAAGKICLRSRSEESACYQIHDKYLIPSGPTTYEYLSLPGHHVAFGHAPTHIFIAHGPEDWTLDNIIEFHGKRLAGRLKDDEERNSKKQLLVNQRYSTLEFEHTEFFGPFLETLYQKGCKKYKGTVPEFLRFNMTIPKSELQAQMVPALNKILIDAGYQQKESQ